MDCSGTSDHCLVLGTQSQVDILKRCRSWHPLPQAECLTRFEQTVVSEQSTLDDIWWVLSIKLIASATSTLPNNNLVWRLTATADRSAKNFQPYGMASAKNRIPKENRETPIIAQTGRNHFRRDFSPYFFSDHKNISII